MDYLSNVSCIKIPNCLIKITFLVKVEIEVSLGTVCCNVLLYEMVQCDAFISFSTVSWASDHPHIHRENITFFSYIVYSKGDLKKRGEEKPNWEIKGSLEREKLEYRFLFSLVRELMEKLVSFWVEPENFTSRIPWGSPERNCGLVKCVAT